MRSVAVRLAIAALCCLPLAVLAAPARLAVKTLSTAPTATAFVAARTGTAVAPTASRTLTPLASTVPATATKAPPAASVTATSTARATGTVTSTATVRATAKAGPTGTARTRPIATATPRPRPTPNPHPGLGTVPWANGEYYVWTLSGPGLQGTAWQLLTRVGHEWIDQSALRQSSRGATSTFSSRLAFDATTYRLHGYDGLQDAPASVLHAVLSGTHLDYTSYLSGHRPSCTVASRVVAPTTASYGLMADLVRTTTLRDGQGIAYALFDPYGTRPLTTASYRVIAHQPLSTVLGAVLAVRVRFQEGAQPPLDVWYSANAAHIVLRWSRPGLLTATLAQYVPTSTRLIVPVAPPSLHLAGRNAACL